MPDDPISRDWILSELRAVRDIVIAEQSRVNDRFAQVNELREQVLQERGVFVRHEGLASVSDRLGRVEQVYVGREALDRLAERLYALEKASISRPEYDRVLVRIGKLEALGPIIVLVAGVIGAVIGGLVIRYFSGIGG